MENLNWILHSLNVNGTGNHYQKNLQQRSFLIVKELAKRPGIIKERAQLMDIAYKENTDIEDRTIDSHVKRIRKKIQRSRSKFCSNRNKIWQWV